MKELIKDNYRKLKPIKERMTKSNEEREGWSSYLSECGCVRHVVLMTQLKRISDCCDVTSGSRHIGAIKRPGGPSPVADCFPLVKIRRARMRAGTRRRLSTCPYASACVFACACLRPCVLWGRWQGPWPPHPRDRQWERSISSNIPWVTKTIYPVKSG